MSPRHDKNPAAPLLRFPRFKSTDLHMTQKQVWNEVVFPSLEAAFARLEERTERMVRDEVARELARRQANGHHQSSGEGADTLLDGQGEDAQDLLEGEDEHLKSWMGDQSDDVRRAIIRAVQRPAPVRWR